MVSLATVKLQLTKAGYPFSHWSKAEVKELCNVLMPGEVIAHATNGYYENGYALLVATDNRLILVDKKPMFLSLDTISYGMIQEITLNYRLLNSTVNIYTSNKVLVFRSWSHPHLRSIVTYVQQSVNSARQYNGRSNNYGYDNMPQTQQQANISYRGIAPSPIDQIPTMPTPSNAVFQYAPSEQMVTTSSLSEPKLPLYRQPLVRRRHYERRLVA